MTFHQIHIYLQAVLTVSVLFAVLLFPASRGVEGTTTEPVATRSAGLTPSRYTLIENSLSGMVLGVPNWNCTFLPHLSALVRVIFGPQLNRSCLGGRPSLTSRQDKAQFMGCHEFLCLPFTALAHFVTIHSAVMIWFGSRPTAFWEHRVFWLVHCSSLGIPFPLSCPTCWVGRERIPLLLPWPAWFSSSFLH